ncbi:MAG: nucleotide exchange factor GrpE [Kiritimatiellae bacterium]|nr:nucleotide exchange factor GrpE [Kiritimatiellia bacterium]
MNNDDLKEDTVVTEANDCASDVQQPVDEETAQAVEAEAQATEPAAENAAEEPTAEENPAEEPTAAENAAEEPAAEENPAAEPEVEPEVEEAQQPSEAEIYRERLIRLQADFDNYRKRMARDKADMIKSANADLLSAMLTALDHIDHALASLEKTTAGTEATESNPYIEGFKLIQNELLRGLDKFGLSPIESIGKPFDVEVHEALSKMPSDSVAPEHVLFEVRKGYMLNGKVLRAAQVIVSAPVE